MISGVFQTIRHRRRRRRRRGRRIRSHRYASPSSPQRRYHEALVTASKRWKKHVKAYVNKRNGLEPDTSRKAGDDSIDFFVNCAKWNDALRPLPPAAETDEQRFFRLALAARLYLMRVLFFYSVQFELHVSALDNMIKIGEMVQYVCHHANLHVAYSFVYLTKWNPCAPKLKRPLIMTGPEHVLGLGLVASEQGWERLHAYLKFMFPMLTSGRPGAEEKYLQSRSLLQVTAGDSRYATPFTYKPHSSRHRFQCVCDADAGYVPCLLCTTKAKWSSAHTAGSTAADAGGSLADSESGGGGGSARQQKKKRGRKTATPSRSRCVCGEPAGDSFHEADGLSRGFPSAALFMEPRRMCRSCAEVAIFIDEIAKPEPSGFAARVRRDLALAARRVARKNKFEVQDEERRKQLADADKALRAKEKADAATAARFGKTARDAIVADEDDAESDDGGGGASAPQSDSEADGADGAASLDCVPSPSSSDADAESSASDFGRGFASTRARKRSSRAAGHR